MQFGLKTPAVITTDSPTGRKAAALFQDAYEKAGLDEEAGQTLNDNPAFPVALRRLMEELSIPVRAPKGGRIHIIRVPVDLGRGWQEAITAANPETPDDWDVRKVGNQYPPQLGEPKECTIILVNFGKTMSTRHVLDWAKTYGMHPQEPRGVFAIGEHKPYLYRELKVDMIEVISLEACAVKGRSAFCGIGRGAYFGRDASLFGDYPGGWNKGFWFAFSRE